MSCEENPISQAPPSPDFHGFGPETYLPPRIIIDTMGEGDEEEVVRISRQRGKGRPRREDLMPQDVNPSNIVCEPRRKSRSSSSTCPSETPSPSTGSPGQTRPSTPSLPSGSRQREYLLHNSMTSFGSAKLPKASAVLSVFLHHLSDSSPQEAAGETVVKLKEVWLHHFGMRLIIGYDSITSNTIRKLSLKTNTSELRS